MDFEATRAAFNAFRGAEETFPFGPDVMVFKVMGKMFGLMPLTGEPARMNLKCDPVRALALRAEYPAIIPGYHMSKTHWNTVHLDGSVPDPLLRELMQHSYDLIVKSLKKADRAALGG